MKSIKFLHISDLHRGGGCSCTEPVGEHKDSSVSPNFAKTITSPMESDFINSITRWQNNYGKIDAIICTGDLGDRGESSKIDEGVCFIHSVKEALGIDSNNVVICPGNHDANRALDSSHMFSGYSEALERYSLIDHRCDTSPFYINDIPFLVVNTCLGAGEKSLFIQKYKELVNSLNEEDKIRFNKELKEAGVEYLDDNLDIPAVTNSQRERLQNIISKAKSSFMVLVMHHNLLPCNMVEIRPYSFVIDAGKTLDELLEVQKDVLIVHGHVHFSSSYVIHRPDRMHCISSIGAGLFNGGTGSSINIIELFCSDDGQHFITIVHEFIEQINGWHINKSTCLCHRTERDSLNGVLSFFDRNPGMGVGFSEIKAGVGCSEKELLFALLSNERLFNISRNKSSNPSDWTIHRN